MGYFDLLHNHKYFDKFLSYFNTHPPEEPHYQSLIKRYYGNGNSIADEKHVAALISDCNHIKDARESLRKEFRMGMRTAKLVEPEVFWKSIQAHSQTIVGLTKYRMDSINPNKVPPKVYEDLNGLFEKLQVVPSSQKRKLVAVSKTLHFLLPDLVMPIDGAIVLRFLKKGDIPEDTGKQYGLFKDVFNKYLELTVSLGLKQSNGDGNWRNFSVPKRIDNAIAGFWGIFDPDHAIMECMICNHTGTLLSLPCINLPSSMQQMTQVASKAEFSTETESLGYEEEIIVLGDNAAAYPILAQVRPQCGAGKYHKNPAGNADTTWEICVSDSHQFNKLPLNAFPATIHNKVGARSKKDPGKLVRLACSSHEENQHQCEASFHRSDKGGFFIGSAKLKLKDATQTKKWKAFLKDHNLLMVSTNPQPKKVILKFQARSQRTACTSNIP